jgi:hypothetical protein
LKDHWVGSSLFFVVFFSVLLFILQRPGFEGSFVAGKILIVSYVVLPLAVWIFPNLFLPDIPVTGRIAIACGLLGCGLTLYYCYPFIHVPKGTAIRPMGWAMVTTVISFLTLVVSLPSALSALKKDPKWVGFTGLVLGLIPFPLASFLLHFAAYVRGFQLAD